MSIHFAFVVKTALITLALLLVDCSGGNPSSPYPGRLNPITGQWTAYGTGTGITAQLPNPFAIPTQASGKTINYVYTAPPGLVLGRAIIINYSVDGNATFAPLPESDCGTGGCGQALIRLFIWGNSTNTNQDRWWCNTAATPLVIGANQTITCAVTADDGWTGVSGQLASANAQTFNAVVSNPFAVGFTFGGMFAGHGDWAVTGAATFKVNSFTVQ